MHEFTRELGARRRVRQTRGRRASPVLRVAGDSACRPGCVAAPGVVGGNVNGPGNVVLGSSRVAARLVPVDAARKTRRGGGREEDRGTELRYNILAPAKRPSCDITTAMRTALPAAHARDSIASYIRPTAAGDGGDKADRRRKKRSG